MYKKRPESIDVDIELGTYKEENPSPSSSSSTALPRTGYRWRVHLPRTRNIPCHLLLGHQHPPLYQTSIAPVGIQRTVRLLPTKKKMMISSSCLMHIVIQISPMISTRDRFLSPNLLISPGACILQLLTLVFQIQVFERVNCLFACITITSYTSNILLYYGKLKSSICITSSGSIVERWDQRYM